MKKIILLLISLSVISCSSDSDSENSTDNPSNPTVPATQKLLIVSNTNISSTQNELLIFVNGSGRSRSSASVKVGDNVTIKSNSTAPIGTQYYISVIIEDNPIVNNYTSAFGEVLTWQHTITEEDFQ